MRKDCAKCGHPYTYHTHTKRVNGKDRVEIGPCGYPGCKCECYEAPKGKGKQGAKAAPKPKPAPREQTSPPIAELVGGGPLIRVQILEVITKLEVDIAGRVFPLEVKKDLRGPR